VDTRIKIILATGLLWSFTLAAEGSSDPVLDKAADKENHPLDLNNFSGTITLTSDYVDRGISNTKERPALQGSLDWNYSGFYLGVWGSNTDYSDNNIEIVYYGGRIWEFNHWSLDVSASYNTYPGENRYASKGLDPGGGQKADYWEFNFRPIYTFNDDSQLLRSVGVSYFYSPDFFGEDGNAHAISADTVLKLPYGFSFNLLAGYQDVAGDKLSSGYNYAWWQVGIERAWSHVNFDLSYHGVDNEAEACGGDLCDARLVFTMSYTFPPGD
jgi:uncharacterized protein (TIGR02001 family)